MHSLHLRLLITLLAAGVLLWLMGCALFRPTLLELFGGRDIGYAIGFVLEALVAASMMEPALRLLAGTDVVDLNLLRRPAINLGLITIGLQIALTVCDDRLFVSIIARQTSVVGFIVCEAAESLLGALTYLPLFTGLSLLTATPRR